MHHTLRYGKHNLYKVICYGDINEKEKKTFRYLVERNAINEGSDNYEINFINSLSELEEVL